MATRADSTAIAGYEEMPIEEFGKAYLRGLGWQEDTPSGPEPTRAATGPDQDNPKSNEMVATIRIYTDSDTLCVSAPYRHPVHHLAVSLSRGRKFLLGMLTSGSACNR